MTAEMVSLARHRRLAARSNKPEPEIARWKCRVPSCITRVGVTQFTIDTLAMFNRELARRHERPIAEHEVMSCEMHQPNRGQP